MKNFILSIIGLFVAVAAAGQRGDGVISSSPSSVISSEVEKSLPGGFPVRYAVSANLAEALAGGTVGMEASVGFARHWSADADVRYNSHYDAMRQRSLALGARWWPWYVYSGMWLSGKARYQEYSASSAFTSEGDRYGGGLTAGYSRMLGRHLNLDVGFGLWAGYETYSVYECRTCGRIRERGAKYFLRPDDFLLALTFVF